jgi:small subunit ribosomal protein S1
MDQVQVTVGIEDPSDVVTGAVDVEKTEAPELEQAGAAEVRELPVEDVEASESEQAGAAEVELPVEDVEASESEQAGAAEVELPVEDVEASESEQAGAAEVELPVEDVEAPRPEQAGVDKVQEMPVEGLESPESEQAGSGEMRELPVEDWDYQRPRRGQVRTGIILAIEEQEIIVDVGAKRDGIVPYADIQRMGPEAIAALSLGDELPVYILRPEDRDGNLLVSLFMARQEKAWVRARALADSGESWEGEVIGYNKGGLVVPLDDIRGFVPASQVPGFPRGLGQEERLERLAEKVGEILRVKVIEINRRKRRLILSATAAQREWRKVHRERLLSELRDGEVRKGRVSSLCSFGAFVDLGGADGLIHLSELSWKRVRHPREVVAVGDEVEVFVLRLDHERQRIGLSLKRLQPEPWTLVEERYELGQLIEGTVTNVVDFGAFVEIEEGVEGLVHVSELTDGSISHPREVVKKDDLLLLRIIRIDIRRKRLGLSLKRVLESEWAEWAARLAVDDAAKPTPVEETTPSEVEDAEAVEAAASEAADVEVATLVLEETAEMEEADASEAAASEVEDVEVAALVLDDTAEVEEAAVSEADASEVEASEVEDVEVAASVLDDTAEVEEAAASEAGASEAEDVEEVAPLVSEETVETGEAAASEAEASKTEDVEVAALVLEESVEPEETEQSEPEDVEELAAVLSLEPAGPAEPEASLAVEAPENEVVEAGADENESVVESGPDVGDEGVR